MLARKAKASRDPTHCRANQMVQIPVSRSRELQRPEADVVQGLVVQQEALIGIFNKLMEGEHSIIWLHDCVRDLRGWDNGEGLHDAVRVFFADLRNEQRTHS